MPTITEVIHQTMVEFDFNRDRVLVALARRKADEALNDAFRLRGISAAVASYQSGQRHNLGDDKPKPKTVALSPAVKRNIENNERLKAAREPARKLVETARLFWDNYRLYGGGALADATRPELLRSADEWETREGTFKTHKVFERALAEKMLKGSVTQTVRDAMTIDGVINVAREYGELPDHERV